MAFYEAIARHDWDRTFELRQDGLLLELSGGASAVVLDLGAPEEPDELPDPMPDAVQLRILDWPRPDEVYWVPLHALSSTIGVAARAMAETKSGKRINPAARDSAVSARPGSPELLSCVTLLRLGAKQTPPARADCINIRSGPGNLSRSLMDDERQVAEMIRALKRSGWSIGDVAYDSPSGRVWIVSGTNGENRFVAEGATERAAWEGACEQARPLGMLRTSAGR